MKRGILFKPWVAWEDLNICNVAEDNGLKVVKLNAYAMVKSRTTLGSDIYIWNDSDMITRNSSRDCDEKKIVKLISRFIKSIKIAKVYGEPFLDVPVPKPFENGTCLYWVENLDDLQLLIQDDTNITLVLKMTTLLKSGFKNILEIEEWITQKLEKGRANHLSVASTHKPVVLKDFCIIHVRYPMKRKTIENVESVERILPEPTMNKKSLQSSSSSIETQNVVAMFNRFNAQLIKMTTRVDNLENDLKKEKDDHKKTKETLKNLENDLKKGKDDHKKAKETLKLVQDDLKLTKDELKESKEPKPSTSRGSTKRRLEPLPDQRKINSMLPSTPKKQKR